MITNKKEMWLWQPRVPSECTNCNAPIFERLADPDSMAYMHSSMVKLQGVDSKKEKHVDAWECKACGNVQWTTRIKVDLT